MADDSPQAAHRPGGFWRAAIPRSMHVSVSVKTKEFWRPPVRARLGLVSLPSPNLLNEQVKIVTSQIQMPSSFRPRPRELSQGAANSTSVSGRWSRIRRRRFERIAGIVSQVRGIFHSPSGDFAGSWSLAEPLPRGDTPHRQAWTGRAGYAGKRAGRAQHAQLGVLSAPSWAC
jgi:hypothetical protein